MTSSNRPAQLLIDRSLELPFFEADLCLKCNICTAACPVAAATDRFPGPKAVGPQLARYRQPQSPPPDANVAWCSGCGVCSRVCPHGVPVAEMNILAKGEVERGWRRTLRDWALSRPTEVARWSRAVLPLARAFLRSPHVRALLQAAVGLAKDAPIPSPAPRAFRQSLPENVRTFPGEAKPNERTVAYFHGCSTNDYEPWLGETTVRVLSALGVRVELPPQVCCGLPLQSNGDLESARKRAASNLHALLPWAERGIPIIGTSTSCTLALKHEYRSVLGLGGHAVEIVSGSTYDFFEYLDQVLQLDPSDLDLQPVPLRALYHAPCQLRAHGVGAPAVPYLQAIPGLQLVLSESECCGIAGTYGLKQERNAVAMAVGKSLFSQAFESHASVILSDSETCRWWTASATSRPSVHPIEVFAAALGVRPLPFATQKQDAA